MSVRQFKVTHHYGDRGDPGLRGGLARERKFRSFDKALAWAVDCIVRPITGDRHPGRCRIQVREGYGHGFSADVWIRPSVAQPGRAVVDVHEPQLWGYSS